MQFKSQIQPIIERFEGVIVPIWNYFLRIKGWVRENCSLRWFLFQLTCFAAIGVLYRRWPSMQVGIAIGAAGVVAAYMTLRDGKWKGAEKFLWIVIIAVLWAIDVHNIFREQRIHDEQQKSISAKLEDTQTKLAMTVGQLETIAEEQKKHQTSQQKILISLLAEIAFAT